MSSLRYQRKGCQKAENKANWNLQRRQMVAACPKTITTEVARPTHHKTTTPRMWPDVSILLYHAACPPSILRSEPVMKLLASEMRKTPAPRRGGVPAGRDGVDADVVVAPFGGEVAAELQHGGFGGVVGGADETLRRRLGQHGTLGGFGDHGDAAAVAPADHLTSDSLRSHEDTSDVHFEHGVGILGAIVAVGFGNVADDLIKLGHVADVNLANFGGKRSVHFLVGKRTQFFGSSLLHSVEIRARLR
ncbi:hypothetical protein KC325_g258 [Hortaea werneckii]|nr:hypothetical protein KC325_g258 [Hortaea werneckii]